MPNQQETCTPIYEIDALEREPTIFKFDLGSQTDKWTDPTIYNPSTFIGETLLARIEERGDETSSEVGLFLHKDGILSLVESAPRLKGIQDPYYLGTFRDPINPEAAPYHVIGGVKISVDTETGKVTDWQDLNYCYKESLDEIVRDGEPIPFLESAHHSKDLRYVQLEDCIAVCPRPQGSFGGKGRIGFFLTENLLSLQSDLDEYFTRADEATLIPDIFADDEWGGINQMIPMPNGSICLIGHKAHRTIDNGDSNLHYRPFSCLLDPLTGMLLAPPVELDVDPYDFEYVLPKRPDLDDVIFTSGIKMTNDPATVLFIGGVKDAAIGMKSVPNPLIGYASYQSLQLL